MRPAVPGAGLPQGRAGPGFLGHRCSAGLGTVAGSTRNSSCRRAVEHSSGGCTQAGGCSERRQSPRADLAWCRDTWGRKGQGRGPRPDAGARCPLLIFLGVWCVAQEYVRVQSWAEMQGRGHSQAGSLNWVGKAGAVSNHLVSGTRARSVPSRRGFPPCLQPPGGSRRLPKGREKALLWPSLVIRPFNCNYFCN